MPNILIYLYFVLVALVAILVYKLKALATRGYFRRRAPEPKDKYKQINYNFTRKARDSIREKKKCT